MPSSIPNRPPPPRQNHYTTLGLPTPTQTPGSQPHLTTSQIKAAYRRALLLHHPDKLPPHEISALQQHTYTHSRPPQTAQPSRGNATPPSIDSITAARDTLLNPTARRAYDQTLLRQTYASQTASLDSQPSIADSVDLDDMAFDSRHRTWRLACRCGDENGFALSEKELLEVCAGYGYDMSEGEAEVVVGCQGCSLVLRVLFWSVMDEGRDAGAGRGVGDQDGYGPRGDSFEDGGGFAAVSTVVGYGG